MKKPYFYVFSFRENYGEVTPTLPNSSSSLWKCSCYMDNLENIGQQTNPKASFVTTYPVVGTVNILTWGPPGYFFASTYIFLNKSGVTVVFISLLFHSLMVNSFLHVILYIFMMISLRHFIFFDLALLSEPLVPIAKLSSEWLNGSLFPFRVHGNIHTLSRCQCGYF